MSQPAPAPRLIFKQADQPAEFELVRRLNYKTFVEEIPQRPANPERSLADDLLEQSACLVCLEGERLAGMVALSTRRPFSLDRKLPNLDALLPPANRPCEIRLLAIERERRGGAVFAGLARLLLSHYKSEQCDLALVSAAASQMKLYRHLGFEPFGPPLGTPAAPYQGMMATWERLPASALRLLERSKEARC